MREMSCEILAHGRNASPRAVANMILKKIKQKNKKNQKR